MSTLCPPYIPLTEWHMWMVPLGLRVCFQDTVQCFAEMHMVARQRSPPICQSCPSTEPVEWPDTLWRKTALAALRVIRKPVFHTLFVVGQRRPNYTTHLTTLLLSAMNGEMLEKWDPHLTSL